MKKVLVSLMIVIALVSSVIFAQEPELNIILPVGDVSESGYRAYGVFDMDGNVVEASGKREGFSMYAEALPHSYDSRDFGYITSVKNQGTFGTCWAHAFVACAEAGMVKKGYEEDFDNYSELHLSYFYHKRNEALGDGADDISGQHGYFGGGNGIYAARFAENYQGLAVESDFPYSNATSSSDFSIDESMRFKSDIRLNYYGRLESAEDTKRAIMEYGAVSISYYSNGSNLSAKNGYYQNVQTTTNHEVAVIGWDDNFSKENFKANRRPTNDGAWLIKNSYGKGYGDDGYMWLSYEDTSVTYGCFYDFEPMGDENKVYSYNGGLANIMWGVPVANVFRASEDETLISVGFESITGNVAPEMYQVLVYVSDTKPTSPQDGTLVGEMTGSIMYDGFNRVFLDEPVELNEGQYFSVIVQQVSSSGQNACATIECGADFSANNGESYAYLNGKWVDINGYVVSGYELKNATVKAYTKTNTATVTFNTRTDEEIPPQTVAVGKRISRPSTPTYDGYEFLGWYTNNTVTEKWNFSKPVDHDMVLYAKWAKPQGVNLRISSEYFNTAYSPTIRVDGTNVKDYTLYFLVDGAIYSKSQLMDSSCFGKWYSYGAPLGSYAVYAEATGLNWEEITSKQMAFTVTEEPKLSVTEGRINIINIPKDGADLYIAEYDENGAVIKVDKRPYTSATEYKLITLPSNLKNPRYFLWKNGTNEPLCDDK